MARKTDQDLLAELEQLGAEPAQAAPQTSQTPSINVSGNAAVQDTEDDPFGDLSRQLAARPGTPRISSTATSKRSVEYTPASSGPPSGRTSEEKARQSRNSAETNSRSYHQASTPSDLPAPSLQQQQPQSQPQPLQSQPETASSSSFWGGGWSSWSSTLRSTATAAVSQAQTLAKELQNNDQLRNLQARAVPTFQNLIAHIAPPISAHERLQIHTTHDILNYPSLDPLIYSTFSRVMSQVEGGDLLVLQRGSESRSRSTSEPGGGYRGGVLGGGRTGWTDGPWWRDENGRRDLGSVAGLKEGTRLARASAESYAKAFFDSQGGVEEAAKRASETLSESNPTRSSDIFLAIQAITSETEKDLFASGAARAETAAETSDNNDDDNDDDDSEQISFAIYLHDPLHSLSFSTLSQPFPSKWAQWLDTEHGLPASILEIIESGGVDPREWVSEWLEEVLSLAVGVVAQRYVARRMGVGEGSGKRGLEGKVRRADSEGVGGEAARAV